jgi:excisionase family DNA binding protein
MRRTLPGLRPDTRAYVDTTQDVPTGATTGVTVPPDLADLVDVLLGYGLDAFAARNGGRPEAPALAVFRAQLATAAASARGRPRRTLAPPERSITRYLTTVQAAALMHVTPRQVRRVAEAGAIVAIRMGRCWWVSADAAEQYPGRRKSWQQPAA